MKTTKLSFLLIACAAALGSSQVSLAEEPQQQSGNTLIISNHSPLWGNSTTMYIGEHSAYEQIQESQVICRYIPNLLEYSGDTLTLAPVVIPEGPGPKKIILIADNPYASADPVTGLASGLKDFGYHFNENEAITVLHPLVYPEEELRWDLNHFSCLQPYLAPDIERTVAGTGKNAFAYVTFTVDESKLTSTAPLHFEAFIGEDEHYVDIIVPVAFMKRLAEESQRGVWGITMKCCPTILERAKYMPLERRNDLYMRSEKNKL